MIEWVRLYCSKVEYKLSKTKQSNITRRMADGAITSDLILKSSWTFNCKHKCVKNVIAYLKIIALDQLASVICKN